MHAPYKLYICATLENLEKIEKFLKMWIFHAGTVSSCIISCFIMILIRKPAYNEEEMWNQEGEIFRSCGEENNPKNDNIFAVLLIF